MESLLVFLAAGVFAGLLAGLFGVGGGLIMVPLLYWVLPHGGAGPEAAMHLALGTSLAVIAATSLSSTWAHHRHGGVLWPVVARLAPGLAVGALLGAFVADALHGTILRRIVGAGAALVAAQMLLDMRPAAARPLPGTVALAAVGGAIGTLSALVGIGGGSLTVPFLTWRSVPVRQAVGTSAACGVPIAWAGAAGYILAGLSAAGRPAGSLGYVVLPAFAAIALASTLAAPLGARLAHALPPRLLKRLFALLLAAVALKLLFGG